MDVLLLLVMMLMMNLTRNVTVRGFHASPLQKCMSSICEMAMVFNGADSFIQNPSGWSLALDLDPSNSPTQARVVERSSRKSSKGESERAGVLGLPDRLGHRATAAAAAAGGWLNRRVVRGGPTEI